MSEKTVPASEDDDSELISSVRQLGPAPDLRMEQVVLKDWLTRNGKAARIPIWELTAAEWAECVESGREYTKDGQFKRYNTKDEDIRFVACCARDAGRARLWPTTEAAVHELGKLGRATLLLLVDAANRVNSRKVEASEENLGETPTGS